MLKRNLCIATVPLEFAKEGTELLIEHTVDYQRYKVLARVVPRPFFDPPRKRTIPEVEDSNV